MLCFTNKAAKCIHKLCLGSFLTSLFGKSRLKVTTLDEFWLCGLVGAPLMTVLPLACNVHLHSVAEVETKSFGSPYVF